MAIICLGQFHIFFRLHEAKANTGGRLRWQQCQDQQQQEEEKPTRVMIYSCACPHIVSIRIFVCIYKWFND